MRAGRADFVPVLEQHIASRSQAGAKDKMVKEITHSLRIGMKLAERRIFIGKICQEFVDAESSRQIFCLDASLVKFIAVITTGGPERVGGGE